VIFRDPMAVAVSFYRFLANWLFDGAAIDQDTFIESVFLPNSHGAGDNYFNNTRSWFQAAGRDDVLPLIYEDMDANLPQVVRRVAEFAGIEADDETIEVATRQSRFDFMKEHAGQFDDNLIKRKRHKAVGLPDGESNKVSTGQSAKHPPSDAMQAGIDEAWREVVGKPTGLEDYAALQRAVRALDKV